jgi:hypothetical protein
MAFDEREVPIQGGLSFQGINIYGKAQLGNTYNFGTLKPNMEKVRR